MIPVALQVAFDQPSRRLVNCSQANPETELPTYKGVSLAWRFGRRGCEGGVWSQAPPGRLKLPRRPGSTGCLEGVGVVGGGGGITVQTTCFGMAPQYRWSGRPAHTDIYIQIQMYRDVWTNTHTPWLMYCKKIFRNEMINDTVIFTHAN